MSEYINITNLSELIEGKGKKFELDGLEIAVFKIKDKIFIVDNLCPHLHAPIISESILEDFIITCPLHGWSFDLDSGKGVGNLNKIRKFEYKIEDNQLFVKIPKILY